MERIKKILKRIFFLPPLLTVLVAVPCFAFVIYVLAEQPNPWLSYLAYICSAYALVISVTGVSGIVRSVQQGIAAHPLTQKALAIPLGRRWVEDVKFRTEISLSLGFVINLFYIVMKMASGIYYRSLWFVSLAVYYALLAVMRFLLLYRGKGRKARAQRIAELHRYRLCGVVLLLMNQALAGIVAFMVHQNRGYEYPGMLIYAMAAYSFYAVTIAIVNLIKFRKHGSPVLSAAKVINLVAAMVSILSLETAMLAQFGGDDDPLFRKVMTGAAGGGLCIIVLGMAVYMIVKAAKEMKKIQFQNR